MKRLVNPWSELRRTVSESDLIVILLRRIAPRSSLLAMVFVAAIGIASHSSAQVRYSAIEVETLRPDPSHGSTGLGWPLRRCGDEVLAGAYAYQGSRGLVRRYDLVGGRLCWIGDVTSPFGANTEFGRIVTSLGDDTLYVGAPFYSGVPNRLGAVVEYLRSPTNEWVSSQVVTLSVDARGMNPIVTDTEQLIIGAGAYVGYGPSVHVFDRDPVSGVLSPGQILRGRPEVIAAAAAFGYEVKLAHDVLAVAIPDMTQPGFAQPETGEVEIFRKVGGQWQLEAFLLSPTPGVARYFGHDIALSSDAQRLFVAEPGIVILPYAPGKVYEFTYRGNRVWEWTQTIQAHQPYPGDSFGSSIFLNGDQLVVGSTQPAATGTIGGEAEVFERDALGQYQSIQVLSPASHGTPIHFGSNSLSFGETLLVADHRRTYTIATAGAVELFQRPLGNQVCAAATPTASALDVFASDGVDTTVPAVRLVDDAGPNAMRFLVLSRAPGVVGAGTGPPFCVAGPGLLRVFPGEVVPRGATEVETWFNLDAPWFAPLHGQRIVMQAVTLGGTTGPILSPGIEYGG